MRFMLQSTEAQRRCRCSVRTMVKTDIGMALLLPNSVSAMQKTSEYFSVSTGRVRIAPVVEQ